MQAFGIPEGWIQSGEAGKRLGCSRPQLGRWIADGTIPADKCRRVDPSDDKSPYFFDPDHIESMRTRRAAGERLGTAPAIARKQQPPRAFIVSRDGSEPLPFEEEPVGIEDVDSPTESIAPPAIRPPAAPSRQLAGPREWTDAMRTAFVALEEGNPATLLVSRYNLTPREATTVLEAFQSLHGATTPVRLEMQRDVDALRAELEEFKKAVEKIAHAFVGLGNRVRSAEAAEVAAKNESGKLRLDTDALRVEVQRLAKLVVALGNESSKTRQETELHQMIAIVQKANDDQLRLFQLAAERAGITPPRNSIGFGLGESPTALVRAASNVNGVHLDDAHTGDGDGRAD